MRALRRGLLATSCLAIVTLGVRQAYANPQQGVVVAGQATINQTSSITTITQSTGQAAINWQSFSVASGEQVRFVQPTVTSITLNRVLGPDLSTIAGSITANGQIVLINPNGTIFTEGSSVTAAGLVATTSNISNQDFMAGTMNYGQASANPNAAVINKGVISIADGGYAVLSAAAVQNAGQVTARLGSVVLGGAKTFRLDFNGDGLLGYQIGQAVDQTPLGPDGKPVAALVTQSGTISADGGRVLISARGAKGVIDNVINLSGMVEADTARRDSDGTLVLGSVEVDGGTDGAVNSSGTVAARGIEANAHGGTVKILGDEIVLNSGASVDVSGSAGGGTALMGGDAHGKGPDANASTVTVNSGASIHADATRSGNGGAVVVWSNAATWFSGKITAEGGPVAGNGGSVETSSAGALDATSNARVDTKAPHGKEGNWLLDPGDIIVQTGGATTLSGQTTTWTIDPSAITNALSSSSVTLSTSSATGGSGDITVNSPINYSGGGTPGLTLNANRNIAINASIGIGSGGLQLNASGSLTQTAGTTISAGSLTVNDGSGSASFLGAIVLTGSGGLSINDSGGGTGVTLGSVNLGSGTAYIEGGSLGVTLAGGTFQGTGTSSNDIYASGGPVLIAASETVSLGGLLSIGSAYAGDNYYTETTAITVNGSVTSNGFTAFTVGGGSFTAGSASSIAAGSGNIYIETDAMSLGGAVGSITTTGLISLESISGGTSFGLGTATGGIQLSAAALSSFSGYSQLTISAGSSGAVSMAGTVSVASPFTIDAGGAITLTSGSTLTAKSLTINDSSGSASLLGAIVLTGSGGLSINDSGGGTGVTLGSVNLGSGTAYIEGGSLGVTLAGGTFQGTGTSSNDIYASGGPVLIAASETVSLGGLLSIGSAYAGDNYYTETTAITVNGSVTSNGFTAYTVGGGSFTAGSASSIAAGSGNIYIETDAMSLGGAVGSITTTGLISLESISGSTSFGLGTATGGIQLSAAALSSFSGYSQLTISAGSSGAVSMAGTVSVASPFTIDAGGAITLTSGSTLTAKSLTINDSSGSASLLGAIALTGSGGLSINDSGGGTGVTLGSVNLGSGTAYIEGGSLGVTLAGGTFQGTGTSSNDIYASGGPVLIAASETVSLGGLLSIGSAYAGDNYYTETTAITVNGSVTSNGFTAYTVGGGSFTAGSASSIAAGSGNIYIETDAMSLGGAVGSITTTGLISLESISGSTSFGLGTATGGIQLSAAALSSFSGYSQLTISAGSSGAVSMAGTVSVASPFTIDAGGAITLTSGSTLTAKSLTINDSSGSASLLGAIVLTGSGGLSINDSGGGTGVTLGSVNLGSGTAYIEGGSLGVTLAGGTFQGTGTSSNDIYASGGPVLIAASETVSLGGLLSIGSAYAGDNYYTETTAITVNGSVTSNGFTAFTVGGGSFTAGSASSIAAGSGNIYIETDAMSLGGAVGSITTTGLISLESISGSTSFGLGTATGGIQLSAAALSSFSGYSQLTISAGSSGAVSMAGTVSVASPFTIDAGGAITLTSGSTLTAKSLTINDSSGSASLLGAIVLTGSGGLSINDSGGGTGVTLGSVNLGSGTAYIEGGSLGVTLAGGTFQGTGTSSNDIYASGGPVLIAASETVSLGGLLSIGSAYAGDNYYTETTAITVNGSVTSNGFTAYTVGGGSFTAGSASSIAAGSGSVTIDAIATLVNTSITSGGSQSYGSPVNVSGSVALSTTNSTIQFVSTLDGPGAVTLYAGTGTVEFGGAVGQNVALGSISITGGNLSLPAIQASGPVTIDETVSNLTIATAIGGSVITLMDTAASGKNIILNVAVSATGSGTAIVLDTLGHVQNNVSGSALNPGTGRWLIYTASPTGNSFGTLTGGVIGGQTYVTDPPASVTQTGNQFIYGLTGTITVTADSYSRVYGGVNPSFGYVFSGDTDYSGTPVLSTTATSSSNAGSYAIVPSLGSLVSSGGDAFAFVNGTLTVTPAALTLTATNASKVYGAVDPTLAYTVGGLVNGDTSAIVTGVSEGTTATASSSVGSYPITLSGGSGGSNYTITSYVPGSLSVTPASLTLTAANASKVYGAIDPTLTYTVGGLVNGDTSVVVTGVSEGTTATTSSSVGSYPITLSGGSGGSNYTIASHVPGSLSVTPASLTLTAANASKVYGAVDPTLTYSVGGLVNGDTSLVVTGVTEGTTATASSSVGIYPITLSGGSGSSNYTITSYVPGSLSVTPASLTLTATNASKIYGAVDPTLSYSIGGLVNGDTSAIVTGVTEGTTATVSSSVGSYPITLSGGSGGSNYTIASYVPGSLSVTPASLTLTAANATKVYGAVDPTLTYTVGGLMNGDTSAVVTGVTEGTTATASSSVGSYPITLSGGSGGSNYTIGARDSGALSVTPASLTLTATNASKVYGAIDPTLTYSVGGLVNGNTSLVVTGVSEATTVTASSSVGSYPITLSGGTGGSNYTIVARDPGTLSVTPASLTLTASNATKIYGAVDPTLTYTVGGLVNGDTSSVVTGVTESTTAITSSAVGSYPITLSGGSAGPNYAIVGYNPGSLSVILAYLTLTATNSTKVYGAVVPTLTYSVSGLVNGDTNSVVTGVTETTSATASSSVGVYSISLSGGSAGPSYSIGSYVPGSLTVTPAALTLTAANASKVYGGVDPTLTYTLSGLVNGDTSLIVTGVAETTTATPASNVGSYPITLSGGSGGPNYTITSYVRGSLSVTPASLTLTAANATKIYGAVDPTLSYSVGGLVNGDTGVVVTGVSEATTVTASSSVGSYPITLSGGSGGSNYTITSYVPGSLSVTPAALTLTATNASKVYGAVDPTLIYTVGGLVNGDTRAVVTGVTEGTTATLASNVGSYPITLRGGSGGSNYTITSYVPGSLSVTPASLTIEALNATKLVGTSNPTLTYSVSGLVNGDLSSIVTGVLESTTATASSLAGNYAITLGGGTAGPNYFIAAELPGILSVQTPQNQSIPSSTITTATILASNTGTLATSPSFALTIQTQQLASQSSAFVPSASEGLTPPGDLLDSSSAPFGTIASTGTASALPVGQEALGPKPETPTQIAPGVVKLPTRPPIAQSGIPGVQQGFSSIGGDLPWIEN